MSKPKIRAENAADTGTVSNHAYAMLAAAVHRTPLSLLDEPTPMTEDATTWAVLTGQPIKEAHNMTKVDVI